jgi:hypothetical protein
MKQTKECIAWRQVLNMREKMGFVSAPAKKTTVWVYENISPQTKYLRANYLFPK